MSDFKFTSRESELECKRYLLAELDRIIRTATELPTAKPAFDIVLGVADTLRAELAPVRMKYPDFLREERVGEKWKSPTGDFFRVGHLVDEVYLHDGPFCKTRFTLSELTEEWELVR